MSASWSRPALAACFTLALAAPALAFAVTIELKNSWMRPAAAGSLARVYVDIISDVPLTLTGASSSVARKTELVKVERLDGSDSGSVVKTMPIAADAPTRLAYNGSYVRLVEIKHDVFNGAPVTMTLQFRDKAGKRYSAEAHVQVRGIALRREGLPEEAERQPAVLAPPTSSSVPAREPAAPAMH